MSDPDQASAGRRELARLAAEIAALVGALLRRRRMVRASLIERHLGTSGRKRAAAAFYLSWAEGGRTRLVYVPREQVAAVQAQVEARREHRRLVRRLRQAAGQLAAVAEQLGQAQAERPGEKRR